MEFYVVIINEKKYKAIVNNFMQTMWFEVIAINEKK